MKQLYYDLLYAIDNLEAAAKSLSLAKKLLEENQIKVRVGTHGAARRGDRPQSEVASREEGVIVAENAWREAEDALKRAIFPENDPLMWEHAHRARPTGPSPSPIAGQHRRGDHDAPSTNRTDMVSGAQEPGERGLPTSTFAKNQMLPAARPRRRATAAPALGGTQLIRDPPTGGPVVDTDPGRLRRRAERGVRLRLPHLDASASTSRYPIPNRSAKAAAAQARISQRPGARQPPPARAAGRGRGAHARAAASRRTSSASQSDAAPRASCRRSGSTPRRRSSRPACPRTSWSPRRSATSRMAEVDELRAIADYRKSLVNFERVQEAGVSGAGASPCSAPARATRRPGAAVGRGGGQAVDPPDARRGAARPPFSSARARRPELLRTVVCGRLHVPYEGPCRLRPARSRLERPCRFETDACSSGCLSPSWPPPAAGCSCAGAATPRATPPAPSDRGDVVEVVGATGTLQAVTTVQVGSQVSGTIQSLNADFNSTVKKGQVVARLDPSLFEARLRPGAGQPGRRARQRRPRQRPRCRTASRSTSAPRSSPPEQLLPQSDLETAKANYDGARRAAQGQPGGGEPGAGEPQPGPGRPRPHDHRDADRRRRDRAQRGRGPDGGRIVPGAGPVRDRERPDADAGERLHRRGRHRPRARGPGRHVPRGRLPRARRSRARSSRSACSPPPCRTS